ncbi:bifunctional oligoribonuclease/PAP phosphatase NrnA [Thermoproteota archaeon]
MEPGFIEYIGERVAIVSHHNADPDAIGSAQGVKELIERLKTKSKVSIVMPADISKLSMRLISQLGLDVDKTSIDSFDTVVIVDSGNMNQLGSWEKKINEGEYVVVLIDHHISNEAMQKRVDLLIHDDNVTSTSELVYRLFQDYQLDPSEVTSKALLAGISFDSKYFSIGKHETFNTAAMLLKQIGDISEIRNLLIAESVPSERIARIKAAQRAEIIQIHGWIIAFSNISSFNASGARGLVSLGADLAVVICFEKDDFRASLRSTQRFYDETGIHLGELVSELSHHLSGSGNGHPTAAGFNGVGSATDLKNTLVASLKGKLGE